MLYHLHTPLGIFGTYKSYVFCVVMMYVLDINLKAAIISLVRIIQSWSCFDNVSTKFNCHLRFPLDSAY